MYKPTTITISSKNTNKDNNNDNNDNNEKLIAHDNVEEYISLIGSDLLFKYDHLHDNELLKEENRLYKQLQLLIKYEEENNNTSSTTSNNKFTYPTIIKNKSKTIGITGNKRLLSSLDNSYYPICKK